MEPVKVQNPQRVQQGATPRLCVVYTAKDSMRTLPRSIASVRLLADRIIVLDSGSVDGTIDASRALGAEVVHQDWLGYARQKQRAIDLAAGSEFVLLLDSDEIPDERLLEAIRSAMKSPGNIQGWWIVDSGLQVDTSALVLQTECCVCFARVPGQFLSVRYTKLL